MQPVTAGRIRNAALILGCALIAGPVARGGVQFIFSTAAIHDSTDLKRVEQLSSSCADIQIRFRLSVPPSSPSSALSKAVVAMEAAQHRYYITAGSSDFTERQLFYSPRTMCYYLRHEPHNDGLYLHEVLSAENGSGHEFNASDWNIIAQYAKCASQTGKKVIWSEWAGGAWGWSDFLAQTSNPQSLAHQVLAQYRKSFVFLWADNRDVRKPSQLSDMLLAERIVHNLGNWQNPVLPAGLTNPVRYSFPHGMSIQDWQWFEMNRDPKGQISPSAGATLPSAMIGGFGIMDYLGGGRFFEFETYWTNPRMFSGIIQLHDYISRTKDCPQW